MESQRAARPSGPNAQPSGLRGIPAAEQPREKLAALGAEGLDDSDLIALLIAVGYRGKSAKALAIELLEAHDGLAGLGSIPLERLAAIKGMGAAKAGKLAAAMEIGRRVSQLPHRERLDCSRPANVGAYLAARHSHYPQEKLGALYVDSKNRRIEDRILFVGTLNAATVAPREVFKHALLSSAAAVILFHNHPSGDPEPSREDLEFTRRAREAGTLLGIQLLDHLILGAGIWISLKERQCL